MAKRSLPPQPKHAFDPIRRAMGRAARLANRMDLAPMKPRCELASTAYCLANPGREYLILLPHGGEVDLSAAKGEMSVEWIHPVDGSPESGAVQGGAKRILSAPFAGDAVLHLRRE